VTVQHFQIADDDRQEIVEVVRDTACELPDRFHLLCWCRRSSAHAFRSGRG
jgi:hypothetical protein